ncbi:uncharacterized protein B0T15DRAFT_272761 [Chaetomium strumarium]|uniref:Pyrroloquinoline quinone-dependent pyranose dehydrogenase beta-propeller domain-containing protein n=1 Tax=Chaetomium strumarium TaxID=1170767 RepID=A0AAJ0LZF2_9PEZI|nr:hypothetical protein B0T15DRAFT_272761 [Chaetomium strumarium]
MNSLMRRAAAVVLLLGYYTAEAQTSTTTTTAATTSASSTTCATVLTPSYSPPVVAKGWKAQLIATGLTRPRSMKFDSNGGLLVVEQGVGVSRLTFADDGGTCMSVNGNTTVLVDRELFHGLELSEDGRTLYVSTEEEVRSHSYDPDAASVSSQQQRLVSNMTNPGRGHVTRTLLLSRKVPGLLLVSRGSAANLDDLAAQQSSGISQIRAYNISNATDTAYNYPTDGLLIGWGLRNSVGVAEHPLTGGIWSVENSADDISRLGRDIHEDNPGEELNFHGFLNDTSALGANYGYPSCFALWNTTDFPSLNDLTVGSQFSLDSNATLNDTTCAQRSVSPRLTFRAHMAPLDIKFQPSNASRAFVSFHGSWNRDHPAGYKLSYVEFNPDTGEPVEQSDSVSAAHDVLTSPDLSACRPDGGCLRPAGLAFDSSGERLFVSSDATGEIWVVMRSGEDEDGGATTTGTETRTGTGGAVTSTSSAAAAAALGAWNRGMGGEGLLMVAVTVLMAAVGGLTFAG